MIKKIVKEFLRFPAKTLKTYTSEQVMNLLEQLNQLGWFKEKYSKLDTYLIERDDHILQNDQLQISMYKMVMKRPLLHKESAIHYGEFIEQNYQIHMDEEDKRKVLVQIISMITERLSSQKDGQKEIKEKLLSIEKEFYKAGISNNLELDSLEEMDEIEERLEKHFEKSGNTA